MDRKEKAIMLHKSNFNCAQSVVCPFCDVMGADPITTFKNAEGFGLGMGAMLTCGAVSGMAMVVGMKMSDGNLESPQTKHECYDMMQTLSSEFMEAVGSLTCSEIKGVETGEPLTSCDECIKIAVGLLEKHLLGL